MLSRPLRFSAPALCTAGLLIAMAAPVGAQEVATVDGRRVLTVGAEAQVSQVPDIARIFVGVSADAEEAKAALDAMSVSVDGVLEVLATLGVEERDIQTAGLTLDQNFDYNVGDTPVPRGFVATSNLVVTLRDIEMLGTVLDQVVSGGANRLGGVSFDVADAEDMLDEARRDAVAEAARRAEVFASAAGVDLGALIAISDAQQGGGPVIAIEQAMRDVPVATGTVSLSAGVRLTYEITD